MKKAEGEMEEMIHIGGKLGHNLIFNINII